MRRVWALGLVVAASLSVGCRSGGATPSVASASTAEACARAEQAVVDVQLAMDLRDLSGVRSPSVATAAATADDAGAGQLAEQLRELDRQAANLGDASHPIEERGRATRAVNGLLLDIPDTCDGLGSPFVGAPGSNPGTTATAATG
jgi:hypothetical protein